MVKSWELKDWESGARALIHEDLIRPELISRSVNELAKGANTEVVHFCELDGFSPFQSNLTEKLPKNHRILSV